jgi:hypothetical protein
VVPVFVLVDPPPLQFPKMSTEPTQSEVAFVLLFESSALFSGVSNMLLVYSLEFPFEVPDPEEDPAAYSEHSPKILYEMHSELSSTTSGS